MSDYRCCIERAANGYTIELKDPKIVAANNKRDSTKGSYAQYQDPNVSLVFQTKDQVLQFLTDHLDTALPEDGYSSSFAKAAAEISDG